MLHEKMFSSPRLAIVANIHAEVVRNPATGADGRAKDEEAALGVIVVPAF